MKAAPTMDGAFRPTLSKASNRPDVTNSPGSGNLRPRAGVPIANW